MANIIGAGPAGLWAGLKLAQAGEKVQIYEKSKKIGEPNHCTGLISNRLNSFVKPDKILNKIDGAIIIAGQEKVRLEKKGIATVIDRPSFDRQLADMAASAGADIKVGCSTNWRDLTGTIIAADGSTSKTRFDMGQKLGFLPALQFDLKERLDQNFVELWYGAWASEFFSWVVPIDKGVRVGMAARDCRPLKDFVLKRFGRFRPTKQYSGLVIMSGPVKKTYFELADKKILLVGDSAGQVKPTTGGGVVMAMTAAEAAAKAILNKNEKNYERLWKQKMSKELFLQGLGYKLIKRKPEAMVRFLNRTKPVLESRGDMDFQSRFLVKVFPQAIRWMFDTVF
ncbi:MAG: NAD(P)/FAD-dependent oxidoreductase [Candidatus Altiarchaeota archaeon]|nr:NAD(P)/FAD-dependent oxidoreductase [Candidatus Altiarchaeota archaeon]